MSGSYFQEDEIVGKIYDARLIRRIFGYLGPYRWRAALAVLFVICSMSLFIVNPWLLGKIVDQGIKKADLLLIRNLSLFYLGIEILVYLSTCAGSYLLQWVGQNVMYDLRSQLFSHLQRLPIAFFDRNPVGRLVTRTTNDVAAMSELFSSGIVVVVGDVVLIVGIALALLWQHLFLGVMTLITIPLLIVAAWYFQSRIRDAYRQVRVRIARVNASLSEGISGVKVVQIFNREALQIERFETLNVSHRESQLQSLFYHAVFTPVVTVINAITIVIILLIGGSMVQRGEVSLGTLVSFLAYAQHFFFPIRDISEKVSIFQSAMASAERVFGLLEEAEEPVTTVSGTMTASPQATADTEGSALPAIKGGITFENVSFSYVPGEPVLKDLSFAIEPCQSVALVGHTGAGKTTIASLLNRFYDIQQGRILIDGLDIRSFDRRNLRRQIALIQQDVFIFSGNVLENIRLWNPTYDEAWVAQVAAEVHAHDFISRLPDGYKSEIYERGTNLSAGQRQLLSFARALCTRPRILILDEATSSVDSDTE
ncbi:MAG TPA: ABC transporter ATP-binding protein, partial [Candidatus Ozemobacteraceae bacterium]|nr:ABC transporter ATP-binding protein [Candidatus Ozemobacteraceae bacterium]